MTENEQQGYPTEEISLRPTFKWASVTKQKREFAIESQTSYFTQNGMSPTAPRLDYPVRVSDRLHSERVELAPTWQLSHCLGAPMGTRLKLSEGKESESET